MTKRFEMRFTGSGGQGVILASVIMAEAAVLDGKNAIQSQSYGPEARGGMCKAEAIVCPDQIWYTKIKRPNFLLALTQQAFEKYYSDVCDDALIIADSSLELPEGCDAAKVKFMPILETAREKVGKEMTANIVAVGAINKAMNLYSDEAVHDAVMMHIPKGTEAINEKALAEGEKLGEMI